MQKLKRQDRDLRPALVFLTGELIAVPIPLEREEVILGRELGAGRADQPTRRLPANTRELLALIRRHRRSEYILKDFGSRNGTQINGRTGEGRSPSKRRQDHDRGANTAFRPAGRDRPRIPAADTSAHLARRPTGLLSSRSFFSELRREAERAKVESRPFCVLMMDIDHFKNVNDTFGHLTGSKTLEEIGGSIIKCLRAAMRPQGSAARNLPPFCSMPRSARHRSRRSGYVTRSKRANSAWSGRAGARSAPRDDKHRHCSVSRRFDRSDRAR